MFKKLSCRIGSFIKVLARRTIESRDSLARYLARRKIKRVLNKCAAEARTCFHEIEKVHPQVEKILSELQEGISGFLSSLKADKDAKHFEFLPALEKCREEIIQIAENGFQVIADSINRRKKYLEDFTLVLFGRTIAGKSTIREALTHGDGKTIGKGEQRATKDVREYYWEGLRIIDTPGTNAYEGEKDTLSAREEADKGDLVLFLVTSDSIQPEQFAELQRIKDQNIPVIVLLNVKYSLTERGSTTQMSGHRLSRFLKYPQKIFIPESLKGHRQRIKDLAIERGIRTPRICYIHAQAAWLSTKHPKYSKDLWNLSQMPYLRKVFREEVESFGTQRRIQRIYDSYIHFLEGLIGTLKAERSGIYRQANFLHEKQQKLKNWFQDFIEESNKKIERKTTQCFRPIKEKIDFFVDEYGGKKEVNEEWKKILNLKKIEKRMNKVTEEIVAELKEYLKEFEREWKFDIEATGETIKAEVADIKVGNIGNAMEWVSIGVGSFAAGWTLGVGIANAWNPVGVGLMIAGGTLAILGGLKHKREKEKFEHEKEKASERLWNDVDETESETRKAYKKWFNKEITTKLRKEITGQIVNYIEQLYKSITLLKSAIEELEAMRDELNCKLFTRLINVTFPQIGFSEESIRSIARIQGHRTKIVFKEGFDSEKLRKISNILGEAVIEVPWSNDFKIFIANALLPAKVSPEQVEINREKRTCTIKVPDEDKGYYIGRQGINVKLAGQLTNLYVNIE